MLEFKEIEIKDKEWVQPLLDHSSYRCMEYSFSFAYLWREIFCYSIARFEDFVIIKSQRETHPPSYLFPAGKGDIKPVIEALKAEADQSNVELIFHAIPTAGRELLEKAYPNQFEYIDLSDYYDYIYESERMISLSGKKLASKRNHINRFKENHPDWVYEPLNEENIADVVAMNKKWMEIESLEDISVSFFQEASSVDNAIEDFALLGMKGGLLRAEGDVIAFTLGDRLTEDTMLVHIEKAFKEIQGAYPMINQQFAIHEGKNYTFINREDDSGQEGLRRAKHSYQPVFMGEKFGAKLISSNMASV